MTALRRSSIPSAFFAKTNEVTLEARVIAITINRLHVVIAARDAHADVLGIESLRQSNRVHPSEFNCNALIGCFVKLFPPFIHK